MKNKRRWIAAGAALAVLLLCAVGHGSVASTRATRPTAVFSEAALAADAANEMTSTTGTNNAWCSGEHLFGDLNGDGSVNNKDLGILQRYINGWPIDSLITTTTTTATTTTTTPTTSGTGEYDPYAGITEDMTGKTVRILIVNGPDAGDTASGDAFKKAYGIRYRFLGVPLDMYKTKLTSMVASKDSPDLAFMTVAGTGDYPAMILKGAVQPLPEGVFDLERDTKLDQYQMDFTSWGGKYYGVMLKNSIEYQRGVVVYNKTLFQERGVKTPYELWKTGQWNRDTFAETAKKMTFMQGTEKIYGFGASDGLQPMLSAAQTDFIKKTDGDKFVNNVTDDKLISVIQWASDLREKEYWYSDALGALPLFKAGKMAMYSDMSWILGNKSGIYEAVTNAEVVPIPSDKGGEDAVQAIDACVLSIPAGAQNVKEACYFARYWLDADNVDFDTYYPNKQFVEMMNYMSNAKNRFSQASAGVCGYDNNSSKLSDLRYSFFQTVNDIPVFLQSQSNIVDGLIARINGQKAPNI